MNNVNVGEQIKKFRTAKNMTQSTLAERVGITKATVSAYENGSRLPSYDVLIKLAQVFKSSIDNLLGYSNKCTIDVTGLTIKQRNTIQEVVSTYKNHNRMLNAVLKEGDSIEDELIRLGYVIEDDDRFV